MPVIIKWGKGKSRFLTPNRMYVLCLSALKYNVGWGANIENLNIDPLKKLGIATDKINDNDDLMTIDHLI